MIQNHIMPLNFSLHSKVLGPLPLSYHGAVSGLFLIQTNLCTQGQGTSSPSLISKEEIKGFIPSALALTLPGGEGS